MISRISSAFSRLLKPVSRGAATGDLTQKEGSNAGFTAWRKSSAAEASQTNPDAQKERKAPLRAMPKAEAEQPGPDELETAPPLTACLSEEEKATLLKFEGKKNYFGETPAARGGVKLQKGALFDKKAA